jgi:hypothetical protein
MMRLGEGRKHLLEKTGWHVTDSRAVVATKKGKGDEEVGRRWRRWGERERVGEKLYGCFELFCAVY